MTFQWLTLLPVKIRDFETASQVFECDGTSGENSYTFGYILCSPKCDFTSESSRCGATFFFRVSFPPLRLVGSAKILLHQGTQMQLAREYRKDQFFSVSNTINLAGSIDTVWSDESVHVCIAKGHENNMQTTNRYEPRRGGACETRERNAEGIAKNSVAIIFWDEIQFRTSASLSKLPTLLLSIPGPLRYTPAGRRLEKSVRIATPLIFYARLVK